MIPKREILLRSQEWRLRPEVVEKDYVLGWMLAAITEHPVAGSAWVFKGGTCLKKCFFETFRFSEDLDFSLLVDAPYDEVDVLEILRDVAETTETLSGVQCPRGGVGVKVRKNKAGDRTYDGSIEYRGPLAMPTGPKIRFDITKHERTFPPFARQQVLHSYPDELPATALVQTYSLEELVAEKCRALIERTRPRDLYDVVHLGQHRKGEIDVERTRLLFHEKCAAKGIATPSRAGIVELVDRSADLRADWGSMLAHPLPALPDADAFVAMLSESLAWLEPSLAPVELAAAPRMSGVLESPRGMRLWGRAVPLDAIRFAASNRLLVELDYTGKHRVVEAYSLRRSTTGKLLLFVAEDGQLKSFDVDGITNVSITSRSFVPRWTIELVPGSSSFEVPTAPSPRRPSRPPRKRRR